MFFGLLVGCLSKKRRVDDEPVFVDEDPPTIYFDPNDPSIGNNTNTFQFSIKEIPCFLLLLFECVFSANRPKKFKPEKRIMEPEFYEALKKRKLQEQEMKTVLYDFFT